MLDFIREAGWGIFPVMFFGALSLGVSVQYVRTRRGDLLALLCGLSVLTLLAGALGTVTGLQASANYIGNVELDEKWVFLIGLRESLNNAVASLVIVGVDAMLVCLSLARSRRIDEAVASLARAAALGPEEPRFAYAYAVGLHSSGRVDEAIAALEKALERHPDDRDLLFALATFHRDAGRRDAAIAAARRLRDRYPDDPDAVALLQQLGGE